MMTNGLCVLYYSPLFICYLVTLVSVLRSKAAATKRPFVMFSVSILFWLACEALNHILIEPDTIAYVFSLKLSFMAFCSVFLFWLSAAYYRIDRRMPRRLFPCLLIVPTAILALALTSPWHHLLISGFSVSSTAALTVTSVQYGPGYYLIYSYSIALLLGIVVIIIMATRNLPAAYRRGIQLFYAGAALCTVCTLVEVLYLDRGNPLDFILIGVCFFGIFIYLAIFTQGNSDYQSLKKSELFNYLDQAIFILDVDGHIVDANRPARRLFKFLGRGGIDSGHFHQILDDLAREGKVVQRRQRDSSESNLYVLVSSFPAVYDINTQPFFDRNGHFGGKLVIMDDTTNHHLFAERLRQTAGVDSLTGLPNRYRHQELLRKLDTPVNLPFSVIVGDVNGLKAVNDLYGHYEGDLLLKAVADVLTVCCPAGGHVTRIGGDEFALLLPKTDNRQAAGVADRIYAELSRTDIPFDASISMGYATKTQPWVNLSTIFSEADHNMYGEKEAKI